MAIMYRGVPAPVSETIWRGKVGTPEKCACIVIVPVSGVPVSGIYCTTIMRTTIYIYGPSLHFSKSHPEQVGGGIPAYTD